MMKLSVLKAHVYFDADDSIEEAFNQAFKFVQERAYPIDTNVHFTFNGVKCEVSINSNKDLFLAQYNRALGLVADGLVPA